MAVTNTRKNIMISVLEDAVDQIKTSAGISDLGEIETDVEALRTAFDTDPATATEANIDAAHDKIAGLSVPSLDNVRSMWNEVDQD